MKVPEVSLKVLLFHISATDGAVEALPRLRSLRDHGRPAMFRVNGVLCITFSFPSARRGRYGDVTQI